MVSAKLGKFRDKFVVIAIIIPLVILSPIIIPWVILSAYFKSKSVEKKYLQFLTEQEGSAFFCYNNRKNSVEHIPKLLLPKLDASVHIIFINSHTSESLFDTDVISRLFQEIPKPINLPILIKIQNQRVISHSINNKFYNLISQHKDISPLLDEINTFCAPN